MKNIEINFSSLRDIAKKLTVNLAWVFLAVFLIFIVMEIFEIQNSINIILSLGQPPAAVVAQKGARINFEAYNQVVQRIENVQGFQPSGGITQDPFH